MTLLQRRLFFDVLFCTCCIDTSSILEITLRDNNGFVDGHRIAVGSYDGWLYGWESNDSETSTSSSSSSSSSNKKNPDLLDIAYRRKKLQE